MHPLYNNPIILQGEKKKQSGSRSVSNIKKKTLNLKIPTGSHISHVVAALGESDLSRMFCQTPGGRG